MKNKLVAVLALALGALNTPLSTALAQGTAFTYQGRLNDSGSPANGSYDLAFTLFSSGSGGTGVAGPLTNAATAVSNGLFTVTLDFGAGMFNGADRWLEIATRNSGGGMFTTLSPRQQVTSTPYAMQAASAGTLGGQPASAFAPASASSSYVSKAGDTMTGTLNLPVNGLVAGANQLVLSGGNVGIGKPNPATALDVNGAVNAASFTGNGAGLSNVIVSASQITGTLADAQLSANVALRSGGNAFSGSQQVADAVITGQQAVDQQQLLKNAGAGGADNWQSFTAGTNGLITAIVFVGGSPLNSSPSPGTISIYTGEGTNGALLASQAVTWSPSFGAQSNAFVAPPYLTAGTQYTIRFGAPTAIIAWLNASTTDVYAGGRADFSATGDYQFQTYMTPATPGATILMVNPIGNSGFVGIGTNAPQAKLHVAGDILATGIITGSGAGLTSLNASNLSSGTIVDVRLSTNVALLNRTNVFTATNRFAGVLSATNVNNQLTGAFTGNGAGLTSLNAATLTGSVPSASLTSVPAAGLTGTVADSRLSGNVALFNGTNAFTGTNRFAGVMLATNANNQMNGSFTGSGAGLTGLSASAISSGTLDTNRIPNLDAGKLTTGALADARLSGNVALRAGGNVFSGSQQVADLVLYGTPALDQQQLTGGSVVGSTDQWQSFTAGTNGALSAVVLHVASPLEPSPSPGTISIYAGEGTTGSLLATQSVTWAAGGLTFQTNTMTTPSYLSKGSQYTIRFTAPSVTSAWVDQSTSDVYAGGRDDLSATADYVFMTYMTPATPGATILMINPTGNSGFVGIGTNAPRAKLHVAGDILASGIFAGNGAGLSNLNAASMAGSVPAALLTSVPSASLTGTLADARLSSNVALLNGSQTFSGANTFSNAANSFTGNGGGLTNLNATSLAGSVPAASLTSVPAASLTGTLADARLSSNVALLNGNQTFSGANTFSNAANSFTGNGGALTNLNAANLAGSVPAASLTSVPAGSLTGSVADARLSTNVPLLNGTNVFTGTNRLASVLLATNSNNQVSGVFTGNGAGLTNLYSTNLTGSVADARLSSNVALLNGNQTFTGANTFSNTVGVSSNLTLRFGIGVPGQEQNAGKIGYQTFTPGALDIVGAGTNNAARSIKLWAEAGVIVDGPVTASAFTGEGGGLNNLNPANMAAGTAGINISGNAATATGFSGSLAGDVTGTQGATVVASVGGQTAAIVASGASAANSASSANAANTIVTRDTSGSFSAGTVVSTNFSGNGGGLSNVSGALPWQVVSSAAQPAQSNRGYLLTNDSLVTVTLPTSPVLGDIVRVTGSGAGGWKLAQNASQYITSRNLMGNIGAAWTAHDSSRNWISIASSADGNRLVALINGGLIYTSTDSGATWTSHSYSVQWHSVASSADGVKLVAVGFSAPSYTSTDSGQTWTASTNLSQNWSCVASSADGTKLVGGISGGPLYTSTDSGASWTSRDSSRQWLGVASSGDGTKLVAVVNGGQIYTSTNSGTNWTARDSNRSWQSVASSTNGVKLVAAASVGQIYNSADSGVTWTARDSSRGWQSVSSSADGVRLAAVEYSGLIYTSTDSGVTWTPSNNNTTANWYSIASSADGTKLAAVVYGGQIYTAVPTSVSSTTTGTAGYLLGGQDTGIELQYVGNNRFVPLSFYGLIQAY